MTVRVALAWTAMLGLLVALAWPQPAGRSLAALLAPLELYRPLPGVAGDYVLAQLRPGPHDDVVLLVSDGTRRVELHVLDRDTWPDAARTASFDVGWEEYGTDAPRRDCVAIRDAVVAAIAANDPGGLRVRDLTRHAAVPSLLERVLDRLRGARGPAAGLLLIALCASLTTVRFGALALAVLLAALGLWLRAAHLDLPLEVDGELQRVFTGHLPLLDAVRFAAWHDRHPPLPFVVLHAVQTFGQSEVIVRLPAVIAGALIGPAILAAGVWLRRDGAGGRLIPPATPAVCAALAACAAPELVLRSREVSELSLFGLMAVVTLSASLYACARPAVVALVAVAAGHALLLWTYYMAPFLLIGFWSAIWWTRRAGGPAVRAAVLGSLAGAPSLGFGAYILLADLPIRQAADRFPEFNWGARSASLMAQQVGAIVSHAWGTPFVAVLGLLALWALVRRDPAVLAPLAAAAAVAAGMVLLVPVARIQPYYFVCALPLLPLALALWALPPAGVRRQVAAAAIVAATAISVPQRLSMETDRIYAIHPEASSRRFAALIDARPESHVAVFMPGYERLIAYSLAQAAGVRLDWRALQGLDGEIAVAGLRQRFVPVLREDDEFAAERAVAALAALSRRHGFLAVLPYPSRLPEMDAWLRRCAELDRVSSQRLLRCPQQAGATSAAEPAR